MGNTLMFIGKVALGVIAGISLHSVAQRFFPSLP